MNNYCSFFFFFLIYNYFSFIRKNDNYFSFTIQASPLTICDTILIFRTMGGVLPMNTPFPLSYENLLIHFFLLGYLVKTLCVFEIYFRFGALFYFVKIASVWDVHP